MRSLLATRSTLPSLASTGRFRPHQPIPCGFVRHGWSSFSPLWLTQDQHQLVASFPAWKRCAPFPSWRSSTVDDEGPSEQCVARCRNAYDAMRLIPASFARVPQRDTGPIYMRFLKIFLAVRMMSKTGNQLNLRDRPTVLSSPFGMPSPFFGP